MYWPPQQEIVVVNLMHGRVCLNHLSVVSMCPDIVDNHITVCSCSASNEHLYTPLHVFPSMISVDFRCPMQTSTLKIEKQSNCIKPKHSLLLLVEQLNYERQLFSWFARKVFNQNFRSGHLALVILSTIYLHSNMLFI